MSDSTSPAKRDMKMIGFKGSKYSEDGQIAIFLSRNFDRTVQGLVDSITHSRAERASIQLSYKKALCKIFKTKRVSNCYICNKLFIKPERLSQHLLFTHGKYVSACMSVYK